jgi:hypothetical protein
MNGHISNNRLKLPADDAMPTGFLSRLCPSSVRQGRVDFSPPLGPRISEDETANPPGMGGNEFLHDKKPRPSHKTTRIISASSLVN